MKKCVITIGRQCGSGGHTIGKTVAERLGIPFYDKKLVQIVAKRSGLSAETVRREGEYSSASSLFTSVSSRGYSAYNANQRGNMALPDQINAYQTELIKELAEKESCVFVGRAAGFVLDQDEEIERLVRIFVYADKVKKVQRTMEVDCIDEERAKRRVKKIDRERREYFKYYTGSEWHNIKNYDLPINTTRLTLEETAELIKSYIRIKGFTWLADASGQP